jgi:hypothetical protein
LHYDASSWRWTEITLGIAALCSLLAFWLLEFSFSQTSPKSSNPVSGAIYPVNWHGEIVYVTVIQQRETDILFWDVSANLGGLRN